AAEAATAATDATAAATITEAAAETATVAEAAAEVTAAAEIISAAETVALVAATSATMPAATSVETHNPVRFPVRPTSPSRGARRTANSNHTSSGAKPFAPHNMP
ncbi:MAG: hypothetical protein JO221_03370, partial [Sphingomonas sp.]|nr:hypothetical protein [Sphingomonas sp.]